MASVKNNNNKRFPGAEELDHIDLRNLEKTPENYIASGAFGDVYSVKDKDGNENHDYAVKFIKKTVWTQAMRAMLGTRFFNLNSLDIDFRTEVDTLFELKRQAIGPDIVYANYTRHYYVIEKMDTTLHSILNETKFTPTHALMFLALIDRYLICDYLHDDFHVNNIMWSDTLKDFRIIDWGIGLRIGEMKEPKKTWWLKDRIKSIMDGGVFWICMVYIKDCMDTETDETELAKWTLMSEKYSEWIKSWWISNKEELKLEPKWVEEYDIFSDKFKRQKYVNQTIKVIKSFRIKKSSSKVSSGRLRKKSSKKKSKKKKEKNN